MLTADVLGPEPDSDAEVAPDSERWSGIPRNGRSAASALRREGFKKVEQRHERSLAMRYHGQSFELEINKTSGDIAAAFHRAHLARYGYAQKENVIEIVSARLRSLGLVKQLKQHRLAQSAHGSFARADSKADVYFDGRLVRANIYSRGQVAAGSRLKAPAIVTEYSSTTLIRRGVSADIDRLGNPHYQGRRLEQNALNLNTQLTIRSMRRPVMVARIQETDGQPFFVTAALRYLLVLVTILAPPKLPGTFIALIAPLPVPHLPFSLPEASDQRLRALYQKSHPGVAVHQCAVELTAAGIEIKQIDRQTVYQWASIEEIVVTEDSVDFFTRDQCGVVLRKRAFATLTEQGQFVEMARKYFEQSRQEQAAK